MLTKIAHILFSVLFVVSTSGFTISIHYCDDEIYSISFLGEAEKCEHYHMHGMNHMAEMNMQNTQKEADGSAMKMAEAGMEMQGLEPEGAMNSGTHSEGMVDMSTGKLTGKKQMGEMNMNDHEPKDNHTSKPHNHCDDKSVNIEKIDNDYLRTHNVSTPSNIPVIKINKLYVARIESLFVQVTDNKPQHIKFESPPLLDKKPALALIQSFRL